jgi:hypothetical protein
MRLSKSVFRARLTDLTLSCAAGPACRSRSGASVAAHDGRRTESRPATGVTPPRCDELGSSAAGPKPGRTSFSVKLGGGSRVLLTLALTLWAGQRCDGGISGICLPK